MKVEDVKFKITFKRNSSETFKENYKIGQSMGSGKNGEVRKCRHKITGIVRAVKILNKKSMSSSEM